MMEAIEAALALGVLLLPLLLQRQKLQ